MAVAAISACNKESVKDETPIAPEVQKGTYVYTINASIAEDETSDVVSVVKSDYNASGEFTWSAGDAISVLFHNGDDNKFFTLTTSGTGKSASFSGAIDDGYTIGASDGDGSNKKIWALFPASSNHTYTIGGTASFFVPGEVDFTAPGAHYSANIPMYALRETEGAFSFSNIACAYKFTVTNLDNTVSKVRFAVSNQLTYGISGSWPVAGAGGDAYINYAYADPGSAKSCLTLTANVSENKAVFYVPTRYYGDFKPIVTIYNADNDYILKRVTASKSDTPKYKNKVQPVEISAPGTGSPFISKFGVDWSSVSASEDGEGTLKEIKATQSGDYLYLFLDIKKSDLTLSDTYSHAHVLYFHLSNGDETGSSSSWTQKYDWRNSNDYLAINGVLTLDMWSPLHLIIVDKNIVTNSTLDSVFLEMKIDRTHEDVTAYLGGTSTYIAVSINNKLCIGGSTYGTYETIGYAPAHATDMLAVTMTSL